MDRVLSFEEALAEVMAEARAFPPPAVSEALALGEASRRVLARAVHAPRPQPPFDRSTRDGFALRAEDVARGVEMDVVGLLRAGERWTGEPVRAGQAVEIMTGAPMPPGADAVLMIEHAVVGADRMRAGEGRALAAGENVVPAGSEAAEGALILSPGAVLDPAAIAVAASCGTAEVEVFAQPRVAVLATGDELVELGSGEPEAWQIVNSNSYALAALIAAAGGVPDRLPIARDTLGDLEARLETAGNADLLLLSGGVSMGKYDLVEQALAAAGAEFFFTGARIQPGKPVVFGRLPRAQGGWLPFFGLPGNPISTEVCFHLFVAPLLRALAGQRELAPRFLEATAGEVIEGKRGLTRFLPARLQGDLHGVRVLPVAWQGSGDLAANARAEAYCVVPEQGLAAGDRARVLLR